MQQISLAFLWHQHQPYYPDDLGGENPMPWVRLHGAKDYWGMAMLLKEVPEVRATINLVPSLVQQILGYTERGQSGVNIPTSWDVKTPEGHVPRFTSIERPAQKAFIVEGSRYLHSNEPSPDYDVNFRGSAGGSFATSGPSGSFSRAFINPVLLDQQQHDPKWDRFSYRHPVAGAPGFNVLFYDGHAERLSKDVAIESVDFWLPTGTKVLVTEYDGSIDGGGAPPTPKPRAVHTITKREQDDDDFYPIY